MAKTLAGAIPNHAPPRWRRAQSVAAGHRECHWGWAGRPLGISFPGGRTKTPRTPKTPRTAARYACEPVKGLRAEALSHWVYFQYEVPSRRSPGSLGCPGCLGQGVGARSGLAPTQPFARRQYAASNAVATSCDPPARQFRSRRDSPAPQASGCPTSETRSLAKQGRKRPSATLPVSGGI